MSKKEIIIVLAIIIIIFLVGFILRVVSTTIPGVSADEKAFLEDDHGLPYMYEMDSYYNYRLTQNYLDHGYIGDTLINGKQWDLHSYYPPGVSMDYPPFIAYLGALFYKIVNIFGSVPLLVVCFWLPAFIAPLAGVVAYLFVRRFTNDYGAAAAGLLMVTAPYYFIRTVPGWYDTDMFNLIFPLLVVWFLVEAVDGKNTRIKLGFTVLAALSMALFALAWNGWLYMFYLMVVFSVIYIICHKLKKEDVKNPIYIIITFIILTTLLVGISMGYFKVINIFMGLYGFITFDSHSLLESYPDVYYSVSELSEPSFIEMISGVGIAFFGGIFGFIWILRVLINENLKKKFLNRMGWFFYLFLIIWTITGLFAITKGGRFIILLIPPLVIGTGIMVGIIIEYLKILDNVFKKKNIIKILSISILVLVLIPAIFNISSSYSILKPYVNDDLLTASQWINNTENNDVVIISDWNWGYFYAAMANLPVSIDGGTQNSHRTYWIDRAFSSSNDSLSLGIFRMLATNGDTGFLTVDNYTNNTTKSVDILNNILGVDNQTALTILKDNYGFNDQEASIVLNYTHPHDPRHFILVTNNGMIDQGYWIFYYGEWDFNKVNRNDIIYSVGKITNNGVTTNGVLIDVVGNITWNGKVPYCVITVNNSNVEKRYLDESSNFFVVLLIDNKESVVLDKRFENSLFTKLVIEKRNSKVFQPVYKNKNVVIWKSNL